MFIRKFPHLWLVRASLSFSLIGWYLTQLPFEYESSWTLTRSLNNLQIGHAPNLAKFWLELKIFKSTVCDYFDDNTCIANDSPGKQIPSSCSSGSSSSHNFWHFSQSGEHFFS